MRILVSWSGTRSQAIATVLRRWLPQLIDGMDFPGHGGGRAVQTDDITLSTVIDAVKIRELPLTTSAGLGREMQFALRLES